MGTDNAQNQAKAQLEFIIAMVERLEHTRECDNTACMPNHPDKPRWGMFTDIESRAAYHDEDAIQQTISEGPLSILVRSGWYSMGGEGIGTKEPVEYEILLCTGGPAVRIRGSLGIHGEPVSARLEYQDWGTPWTEYRELLISPADWDSITRRARAIKLVLLTYAQQFYFGD